VHFACLIYFRIEVKSGYANILIVCISPSYIVCISPSYIVFSHVEYPESKPFAACYIYGITQCALSSMWRPICQFLSIYSLGVLRQTVGSYLFLAFVFNFRSLPIRSTVKKIHFALFLFSFAFALSLLTSIHTSIEFFK
jgi:hypothetical protein